MNLFYTPEVIDGYITLEPEESRHVSKVLRMKAGNPLVTTDGKGFFYHCVIADNNPRRCQLMVNKAEKVDLPWQGILHMAVAPTKNINRYEWFLEKATEIGVNEITPIITFHSERREIKEQRLDKVLVAAMKQSLKAVLPALHPAVTFEKFVVQPFQGQKFIAFIDPEVTLELAEALTANGNAMILIGPEGDFSKQEVELAVENGFVPVRLGLSRLRTETAALAACHTYHVIDQLNEKGKP